MQARGLLGNLADFNTGVFVWQLHHELCCERETSTRRAPYEVVRWSKRYETISHERTTNTMTKPYTKRLARVKEGPIVLVCMDRRGLTFWWRYLSGRSASPWKAWVSLKIRPVRLLRLLRFVKNAAILRFCTWPNILPGWTMVSSLSPVNLSGKSLLGRSWTAAGIQGCIG